MKNFLDIAQERYTTKTYDASRVIPEEQIDQLKEIARLAPSSINSQPWHFTFVADPAVKAQLADASFFNGPRINEASHLVVFSSMHSIEAFETQINTYLPEGAVGYYNQFLKDKPKEEIRTWLAHQVYLSLGFVLGAAYSMGIDSTPMEGIEPEKYASILGLENHKPLFALALGYRNPEDGNMPSKNPKSRIPMAEVMTSI